MNTVCDDLRKAEAWAANHPPHSVAGYHATYYYFTDHLGSCSKTFYRIMWYHTVNGNAINTLEETGVNSVDTTYYPYGKFYTYERNAERFFSGKEKEGFPVAGSYDSGIYYFGGRYYDQTNGIFIQKDPMMQNPSPYLYTNGNPVNRIDPTGLVDETNMPDFYYQWMKNGGHSFGGMTVGAPQLAGVAGQQYKSINSTTIYPSAGTTKTDMVATALKFIVGSTLSRGSTSSSASGGGGTLKFIGIKNDNNEGSVNKYKEQYYNKWTQNQESEINVLYRGYDDSNNFYEINTSLNHVSNIIENNYSVTYGLFHTTDPSGEEIYYSIVEQGFIQKFEVNINVIVQFNDSSIPPLINSFNVGIYIRSGVVRYPFILK